MRVIGVTGTQNDANRTPYTAHLHHHLLLDPSPPPPRHHHHRQSRPPSPWKAGYLSLTGRRWLASRRFTPADTSTSCMGAWVGDHAYMQVRVYPNTHTHTHASRPDVAHEEYSPPLTRAPHASSRPPSCPFCASASSPDDTRWRAGSGEGGGMVMVMVMMVMVVMM